MTDKEKLSILQSVLHSLQCRLQVSMEHGRVSELLEAICNWSYSHRSGELTDEEREVRIVAAYAALERSLTYRPAPY